MTTEKKLLKKSSLEKFFNVLKTGTNKIFAPKQKGNQVEFEMVDSFSQITFDYIATNQSAKHVVFPRAESMLRFVNEKDSVKIEDFKPAEIPELVLFGTRSCDAAGFASLGGIFTWEYNDTMFSTRLQKLTLISFSCEKSDDFCFCTSVGGNPGNTVGSDILLTKIANGDFLVEIMTEKGKAIATKAADLLEVITTDNKNDYLAKVPVRFNHTDVNAKMKTIFDSPIWKEQSFRCVGCGACAYVCPACACFDIQDEIRGKRGKRVKCWDSCGFRMFTLHTSGHNPREVQSERWRQRLMHKFVYMPERQNVYGCVGCGRCSRACPVDMNIAEHVESVVK